MSPEPNAIREPGTPAEAPSAGRDTTARNALASLLAHGLEPEQETSRVALGLVLLIAFCAVVLNVGVYQSARDHLVRTRWHQLGGGIDDARRDIRAALGLIERETRYIAAQTTIAESATRASRGALAKPDRDALEADLARAANTFHFDAIRIVAGTGAVLANTAAPGALESGEARAIARRAAESGRSITTIAADANGSRSSILMAVPMGSGSDRAAESTALFSIGVDDAFGPVLRAFPFRGEDAGAYLVGRSGQETVILSAPPAATTAEAGSLRAAADLAPRSVWSAASGVESRAEIAGHEGQPVWIATRFLPELSVGLVGQVDRSSMLTGLRDTLTGLLLLDVALLMFGIPAIWLRRRRDTIGRTRREREIAGEQASRLQEVFDHAFDAILSFDARGRVLAVNKATQVLFQRGANDIVGEGVHRFLRCGIPGKPGTVDPQALRTTTCSQALAGDGTVIPVEYSLACAGEGDDRVYTAVVRDISERVNAEERIRSFAEGLEVTNRRLEEANAQLEEASRLKSEFLANTSHELRTPLNGMIGFLQLVLDGMCDSRDEERDFLQQALQCSRHLLGLINDVLDIAKIEAGKLTLEIEAVDVRALFGEVYTLTHVQAAQKGISLKFESPDHPTFPARGDFGKIKQVLVNLLGNSIKFTTHGSIVVRATERPDLGHYLFEVIDTGIGIPADRQRLIFEKFTQGDGSSTRKYGGTGLGLAISRSLVELMGGIIDAHSDGPGKGTRIFFSLPLWRAAEELEISDAAASLDRIEGPTGGPLILVVEDDSVFRQFLSTLLHKHGYRTVEATHAEAGWMLARRLHPSLVVLDYALSSAEGANLRTGWDLAERMTTDPRTRHIPLIFVTGFDLQLREKLKASAFARKPEHLMKPIEGSLLMSKVEEMVGSGHTVIRVLMADDDPSVAAYVRKVLPETRFHLEVANNGEECLHFLRTQPRGFDLLLLDLMMPDVSGYDVLRELSLTSALSELPVLVLTNFPEARTDEEKRLLEKGLVLDVLAKGSVHDNPLLLSHIIDWHLQVAAELGHAPGAGEAPGQSDPALEEAA